MSRVLRAACAAVLSLVLLAPTVAHADRWTSPDEIGDVEGWTYDPEPKPCGTDIEVDGSDESNTDITGLAVRHTRRTMIITTRFAGLEPGLEQWVALYVRSDDGGWWLDVDRFQTRSGSWRVTTFMAEEPRLPDPDDVEGCGIGIALMDVGCRTEPLVDFDRDLIRLVVPRRCMGNPRWVRVGADAYRFVEPTDPDDESFTVFSDEWDGGVELSYWMPPFGPRVRATTGALLGDPAVGDPAVAPSTRGQRRHLVVRDGDIFARR